MKIRRFQSPLSSIYVQTTLNDLRRKLELANQPIQQLSTCTSQPVLNSEVLTASNAPNSTYQSSTSNERKFNIVVMA